MNMNFDFNNPTKILFGSGKPVSYTHLTLPTIA